MSLSSFGIFNHVPHKRYCVHRSYQSTLNNYIQLLDFANRRQAIPHGMLIQCPHSTPAPPTQHLKLLTGYGRGPFQYGCTIVVSHTGKEIKWKTLLHQLVLLIFFWGICPIETLQVTITAMLAVPREQTELLGFFASMVAVQMKRRMLKSIIYVFGLHPRYFNMCISWYIAVDMKSGLNSQSRDDLFVLRPSSPTPPPSSHFQLAVSAPLSLYFLRQSGMAPLHDPDFRHSILRAPRISRPSKQLNSTVSPIR